MPHTRSTRPCVLLVSASADRFRATHCALKRMGAGIPLEWARTPLDAIYWIYRRSFQLVLVDLALDLGGRVLVSQIARSQPRIHVLALTDQGEEPHPAALTASSHWGELETRLPHWLPAPADDSPPLQTKNPR